MGKRCIICGEEAKLQIKGTSDFYCDECAAEHFDDVDVLVSVDEQARKIKEIIEQRAKETLEENEEPLKEEKPV